MHSYPYASAVRSGTIYRTMRTPRPHLPPISLTLILLLCLPLTVAWWDQKCAEDGQCSAMFKSYETLMMGTGCRSFYLTGKCSRICTYSVRSLIGRHTWAKCAERCEWSKAVTDGIASWLELCLANPGADVFEKEDAGNGNSTSYDGEPVQAKQNGVSLASGSRAGRMVRWFVVGLVVLVLCAVVVVSTSTGKRYLLDGARHGAVWIGRWRGKHYHGKSTGKGPLDGGPRQMERSNLQRGARRHLKAMRATLD